MPQLNLLVGGMSCRGCVREVTALMRDVPGVVTVRADATRSTITLHGTMHPVDVLAAFAGSSFTPSLVPAATELGEQQEPRPGPTA